MAKHTYYDSAFGIAVYPHLNRPDNKFNAENPLFKTGLRLEGEAAQRQKEKVDVAAQAAFDDYFENGDGKSLTPGERKKFAVYYPYEVEEDSDGNPTGAIVFDFKQNARIRLKDGTVKDVVIGLYDAAGKEMHKLVRGGSEIRINYCMRPIPMKSLKQIGVRLDFSRVQVRKLSEGNGGGFGAVEGYQDDGQQGDGFGSADETPSNPGADY
ncbi:hypothetical protein [Aminobacter sp. HY435]|uniref:hypothetical protein n=1 Tax=Aminobacter sp. HY435 TaxID=2970917 RepID=UPI0022B960A4|nr:hypothetical protein [Aminobacter sp. HY435]